MKTGPSNDLSKLCVHTITTKPLDIETAIIKYADYGIKGISVWRDAYGKLTPRQAGNIIRKSGLVPVSLCRGGFFPSVEKNKREAAVRDNIAAIEEAYELGTPMVVLVCGADPWQSPETSRSQIKSGIESILPVAEKLDIKLAIEPLHPVYADTRSAINTVRQANEMAAHFNSPWLGVAVDVYHVWWDDNLENEIMNCGKANRLFAFHICDWKVPTVDILLDRGIMGEGCIDIPQIRKWVNNAGFNGFNEVEIFSEIYWKGDQDKFLASIIDAYHNYV
ncbi:MAG: sugar phosphate isomerase/epimerase family protein [Bacteroidales bacterium]